MVDANQLKALHAIELELSQIYEETRALERQKVECDAAIQELEGAPVAYKIIGSIMIQSTPAELLSQTKSRAATIEKQLSNLKKRQDELSTKHKNFAK